MVMISYHVVDTHLSLSFIISNDQESARPSARRAQIWLSSPFPSESKVCDVRSYRRTDSPKPTFKILDLEIVTSYDKICSFLVHKNICIGYINSDVPKEMQHFRNRMSYGGISSHE